MRGDIKGFDGSIHGRAPLGDPAGDAVRDLLASATAAGWRRVGTPVRRGPNGQPLADAPAFRGPHGEYWNGEGTPPWEMQSTPAPQQKPDWVSDAEWSSLMQAQHTKDLIQLQYDMGLSRPAPGHGVQQSSGWQGGTLSFPPGTPMVAENRTPTPGHPVIARPLGQPAAPPAEDLQPFITHMGGAGGVGIINTIPNKEWGDAHGMVWVPGPGMNGGTWVPKNSPSMEKQSIENDIMRSRLAQESESAALSRWLAKRMESMR